jgi:hypothetical protein
MLDHLPRAAHPRPPHSRSPIRRRVGGHHPTLGEAAHGLRTTEENRRSRPSRLGGRETDSFSPLSTGSTSTSSSCSRTRPAVQPGRVAHRFGRRRLDRDRTVGTTVNGPGSMRKERSATATATIVFDGTTLVNGAANFPFPAPFIRVDTEK